MAPVAHALLNGPYPTEVPVASSILSPRSISLVSAIVLGLAGLTGCTDSVGGGGGEGGEGGAGGDGSGDDPTNDPTFCAEFEGDGCSPGETSECSVPDPSGQ